MTKRTLAAYALVSAAVLAVYAPSLAALARQWMDDENYSHGLVAVPLAVFFAWRVRGSIAARAPHPRAGGFALVAISAGLFVAGQLGAELFLTRVSLLGVIAGAVLALHGVRACRALAFPFMLVLLAIPLPSVILNQVAFPLQLLASRAGEAVVSAAGIPILREGNVLVLPDTTLEVVEACSGIRSLASLVTIALVLGKVAEPRRWARGVLACLAVPVAILANAARVAGTGLTAAWIGPEAADGFLHAFSGWLVFVVAFSVLFACVRLLRRVRAGTPRARLAMELS